MGGNLDGWGGLCDLIKVWEERSLFFLPLRQREGTPFASLFRGGIPRFLFFLRECADRETGHTIRLLLLERPTSRMGAGAGDMFFFRGVGAARQGQGRVDGWNGWGWGWAGGLLWHCFCFCF